MPYDATSLNAAKLQRLIDDFSHVKNMPDCAQKHLIALYIHFKAEQLCGDGAPGFLGEYDLQATYGRFVLRFKEEKLADGEPPELKDLTTKKLASALRQTNPVNLPLLTKLLGESRAVTTRASREKVLAMGNTGSGKSTTIHFLAGAKMVLGDVEGVPHIQTDASDLDVTLKKQLEVIKTSAQKHSETRTLNSINIQELEIWDSPGFDDTAGVEQDITNTTGITMAVNSSATKPVFVISKNNIGDRGRELVKTLNNFAKLIPSIESNPGSIAYVFTKYKEGELKTLHADLLSLAGEDWVEGPAVAMIDNMKKRTASAAELLSNNILLLDYSVGEEQLADKRTKFISSLNSADAIVAPDGGFHYGTTEESEQALKLQIEKQKHIIKNALERVDPDLFDYKMSELQQLNGVLGEHFPEVKQAYEECIEIKNNFAKKLAESLGRDLIAAFQFDYQNLTGENKEFLSYTEKGTGVLERLAFLLYLNEKQGLSCVEKITAEQDRLIEAMHVKDASVDDVVAHLVKARTLALFSGVFILDGLKDKYGEEYTSYKKLNGNAGRATETAFDLFDDYLTGAVQALKQGEIEQYAELMQKAEALYKAARNKAARKIFEEHDAEAKLKDAQKEAKQTVLDATAKAFAYLQDENLLHNEGKTVAPAINLLQAIEEADEKIYQYLGGLDEDAIAGQQSGLLQAASIRVKKMGAEIPDLLESNLSVHEHVDTIEAYLLQMVALCEVPEIQKDIHNSIVALQVDRLAESLGNMKNNALSLWFQINDDKESRIDANYEVLGQLMSGLGRIEKMLKDATSIDTNIFDDLIKQVSERLKLLSEESGISVKDPGAPEDAEAHLEARYAKQKKKSNDISFALAMMHKLSEYCAGIPEHLSGLQSAIADRLAEDTQGIVGQVENLIKETDLYALGIDADVSEVFVQFKTDLLAFKNNKALGFEERKAHIKTHFRGLGAFSDALVERAERVCSEDPFKSLPALRFFMELAVILASFDAYMQSGQQYNKASEKIDGMISNQEFAIRKMIDAYTDKQSFYMPPPLNMAAEKIYFKQVRQGLNFSLAMDRQALDVHQKVSLDIAHLVENSPHDLIAKLEELSKSRGDRPRKRAEQAQELRAHIKEQMPLFLQQLTSCEYVMANEIYAHVKAARSFLPTSFNNVQSDFSGQEAETLNREYQAAETQHAELERKVAGDGYQQADAEREAIDNAGVRALSDTHQTALMQAGQHKNPYEALKTLFRKALRDSHLFFANTIKEKLLEKLVERNQARAAAIENEQNAFEQAFDEAEQAIAAKGKAETQALSDAKSEGFDALLGLFNSAFESFSFAMAAKAKDGLHTHVDGLRKNLAGIKDDGEKITEKLAAVHELVSKYRAYKKNIVELSSTMSRVIASDSRSVSRFGDMFSFYNAHVFNINELSEEVNALTRELFNSWSSSLDRLSKLSANSDAQHLEVDLQVLMGLRQFNADQPALYNELFDGVKTFSPAELERTVGSLHNIFMKKHERIDALLRERTVTAELGQLLGSVKQMDGALSNLKTLNTADEEATENKFECVRTYSDTCALVKQKLDEWQADFSNSLFENEDLAVKASIYRDTHYVHLHNAYQSLQNAEQHLSAHVSGLEGLSNAPARCMKALMPNLLPIMNRLHHISEIPMGERTAEDYEALSVWYGNLDACRKAFPTGEVQTLLDPFLASLQEKIINSFNEVFEKAPKPAKDQETKVAASALAEHLIDLRIATNALPIEALVKSINYHVTKKLEEYQQKAPAVISGLSTYLWNHPDLQRRVFARMLIAENQALRGQEVFIRNSSTRRVDFEQVLGGIRGPSSDNKAVLKTLHTSFHKEYWSLVHTGLAQDHTANALLGLVAKIKQIPTGDGTRKEKVRRLLAHLFAYWTIDNSSFYKEQQRNGGKSKQELELYLMQPHPAQILGLFRLFSLDQHDDVIKSLFPNVKSPAEIDAERVWAERKEKAQQLVDATTAVAGKAAIAASGVMNTMLQKAGIDYQIETGSSSATTNTSNAVAPTVAGPKKENHVAEVPSGQGKSVVQAIQAAVMAVLGDKADAGCYSDYLTGRDYRDFKSMFVALGLVDENNPDVDYGTLDELADKRTRILSDIRNVFAAYIREGEFPRSKPFDLEKRLHLLLDELDKVLDPEYINETFTVSGIFQDKSHVKPLLDRLWREKEGFDSESISLKEIKEWDEYKTCMLKYTGWEPLFLSGVKNMVLAIQNRAKHTYYFNNASQKVGYLSSGSYNYDKVDGYNTLCAYYAEHDKEPGNTLLTQNLEEKIGFNINYGIFSRAKLLQYDHVNGVSGTLETTTRKQKDYLRDAYGVANATYLPSAYPEAKGADSQKFNPGADFKVVSEEDHAQAIVKEMESKLKPVHVNGGPVNGASEKRAALLFFENQAQIRAFLESPAFSEYKANAVTLTEATGTTARDAIVNAIATPGRITLATAAFRRGMDAVCRNDGLDKAGGLHVLATRLCENMSEQEQEMKRTQRQGSTGSYSMVISAKELADKFADNQGLCDSLPAMVNTDAIQRMHSKNAYVRIMEARQAKCNTEFDTAITKSQAIGELHDESMGFMYRLSANTPQNEILRYLQKNNPELQGALQEPVYKNYFIPVYNTGGDVILQSTIADMRAVFASGRELIDGAYFEPKHYYQKIFVCTGNNPNHRPRTIVNMFGYSNNLNKILEFLNGDYKNGVVPANLDVPDWAKTCRLGNFDAAAHKSEQVKQRGGVGDNRVAQFENAHGLDAGNLQAAPGAVKSAEMTAGYDNHRGKRHQGNGNGLDTGPLKNTLRK